MSVYLPTCREARNIYSVQQYVAPHTTRLLSSAIAQASRQFASQIVTAAAPANGGGTGNITALNAALTGKALSYPFWYSQFNLRPYDQLAVSLFYAFAIRFLTEIIVQIGSNRVKQLQQQERFTLSFSLFSRHQYG